MTDDRIAALAARRSKKDKHPARTARVMVAGVSMSALASLVSAFTVQAAINRPNPSSGLPVAAVDPSADPTVAAPPTTPAPATPAPIRQVVEVDAVQPPTPVAAPAAAPAPAPTTAASPLDGLQFNGIGSIGGGSIGGGSSGGSGGSR